MHTIEYFAGSTETADLLHQNTVTSGDQFPLRRIDELSLVFVRSNRTEIESRP